jgi:hypothetical protein
MSESARPLTGLSAQRKTLKAAQYLMILVLAGCFGPAGMHYDMQQYNKEVLSSEKEMLLYNIAALREGQPPHFTMLSNVSASRMYTASSTFTFTNLWNKLFLPANPSTTSATKGSNSYAAAATAGLTESPTIAYIPIQGQDFANRFESPLTADKLNIFLEDITLTVGNREHENWFLLLVGQDLDILHGNSPKPEALGTIGPPLPIRTASVVPGPSVTANYECPEKYINKEVDYDLFSNCISLISRESTDFSEIDANHLLRTTTPLSKEPSASEVLTAQQANLNWVKDGSNYRLVTQVNLRGLLDYTPVFKEPAAPAGQNVDLANNLTPPWWETPGPGAPTGGLNFNLFYNSKTPLPPNYHWHEWRDGKGVNKKYVLLPDKYVLWCHDHGSKCGIYPEEKPIRERGAQPSPKEQRKLEFQQKLEFSYANKIADYLWPEQLDAIYVEMRKKQFTDEEAERECFPEPSAVHDQPDGKDLVCGFIKTGNLGVIMQNLARMACTPNPRVTGVNCPNRSVIGVGSKVPTWATDSAPYTQFPVPVYPIPKEWTWVPAHDPNYIPSAYSGLREEEIQNKLHSCDDKPETFQKLDQTVQDMCHQRKLGERDKFMFSTLYKLYEMALVNTSQLVAPPPAITIGK